MAEMQNRLVVLDEGKMTDEVNAAVGDGFQFLDFRVVRGLDKDSQQVLDKWVLIIFQKPAVGPTFYPYFRLANILDETDMNQVGAEALSADFEFVSSTPLEGLGPTSGEKVHNRVLMAFRRPL